MAILIRFGLPTSDHASIPSFQGTIWATSLVKIRLYRCCVLSGIRWPKSDPIEIFSVFREDGGLFVVAEIGDELGVGVD